jgi:hypothetical protein
VKNRVTAGLSVTEENSDVVKERDMSNVHKMIKRKNGK